MNETRASFLLPLLTATRWISETIGQMFAFCGKDTMLSILFLFAARVSRIIAFILPLKVVILAGSRGIPSYFAPIIPGGDKLSGVVILSMLSIFFYCATFFLEARARAHIESGSSFFAVCMSGISVIADQKSEIYAYYFKICSMMAYAVFIIFGWFIVATGSVFLAAYMFVFLIFSVVFSFYSISRGDVKVFSIVAREIDHKLSDYLNTLSSLAFLSGFIVILYPFFAGKTFNVLLAIIVIAVFRQMLSSAVSVTKEATSLYSQFHLVNALFFPEKPFRKSYGNDDASFSRLLKEPSVEHRLSEIVKDAFGPQALFTGAISDPVVKGVRYFNIAVTKADAGARCSIQQQVYTSRLSFLLENEKFLFSHMRRSDLCAPKLLGRFALNDLQCALYGAGDGNPPGRHSWERIREAYLTRIAKLEPAAEIDRIYRKSFVSLGHRLNTELVRSLEVAIARNEDEAVYGDFTKAAPRIGALLDTMPRCIWNPDFTGQGVMLDGPENFYVMNWGNWRLEPIGCGFSQVHPGVDYSRLYLAARQARKYFPAWMTSDHLTLADNCSRLEKAIEKANYRTAFALLTPVLHHFKTLSDSKDTSSAAMHTTQVDAAV